MNAKIEKHNRKVGSKFFSHATHLPDKGPLSDFMRFLDGKCETNNFGSLSPADMQTLSLGVDQIDSDYFAVDVLFNEESIAHIRGTAFDVAQTINSLELELSWKCGGMGSFGSLPVGRLSKALDRFRLFRDQPFLGTDKLRKQISDLKAEFMLQ